MKPELRLAFESWDEIWPEAKPLFEFHHETVGASVLGPLAMDEVRMAELSAAGVLRIATARRGAELVGYCMWYMTPNLTSVGVELAQQGPWFSAEPGVGLSLFNFTLVHLEPATVALVHHWPNNARLGRVFAKRYGAVEIERVFAIQLSQVGV